MLHWAEQIFDIYYLVRELSVAHLLQFLFRSCHNFHKLSNIHTWSCIESPQSVHLPRYMLLTKSPFFCNKKKKKELSLLVLFFCLAGVVVLSELAMYCSVNETNSVLWCYFGSTYA